MRAFLLALLLALVPTTARAEEKISKIDRAKVIGAPVLDHAPRGIHVWLEDGWYRVAAVTELPVGSKRTLRRHLEVMVKSTKPIKPVELDEWKKVGGGEHELLIKIDAGPEPAVMRFKTEGDLTIEEARFEGQAGSIYVGPLAKAAGPVLKIGRY